MRLLPTASALYLVLGFVASLQAATDPLEAGFASPPADARPLVWWHWINGNISKAGIEADLADMKRVGIAGAQMFDASIYLPAGPVRYGTEQWHEHVQHAIRTAGKLGLEFHAMNTPGWSASGGPWISPERSMKKLVWSETPADGGGPLALALARPELPALKFRSPPREPMKNFYRDVAVFAVPADATRRAVEWNKKTKLEEKTLTALPLATDPAGCIPRARILDLTAKFDPATGAVRADLPPGQWTILRFGFTSTGATNHPAAPEGHGLEVDKMDPDAVSMYFEHALGRMLREAGPLAGKTFRAILFDSFEGGPQNWTDTFPAQFQVLKGYDLMPLLPVLTGRMIECETFTECLLRDFRGVVEELIARNYFGTMRRRAHEHGLITYAEAQGGPLNPVSCAEYVDVPMNEFWMPEATPRIPRIKLVASAANVLGRPVVAAESFTATPENGRWQNTPARLKVAGDTAWTAGINRFILHHYTHQPTDDAPGFGLGRYGTNFGRLNSWWPLAQGWVDYVARGQFLLQQGRTVADIAFLQNEDHGYAYPAKMVVTPAGYDFDIVYPRHLAAMTWRDGALRLPSGAAYRVLVLPENWAADLPTLRRLSDWVRAGAAIVGPAPVAPAGVKDFEARTAYQALVENLWVGGTPTSVGPGGRGAGLAEVGSAGMRRRKEEPGSTPPAVIKAGAALVETLRALGVAPDVRWVAASGGPAVRVARRRQTDGTSAAEEAGQEMQAVEFRAIHRRTAAADIFFVFNHTDQPAVGEATFRVTGRRPELWDAVAGTHADAPVFRTEAGGTTVPLHLEPHGSTFVVFRRPLPERWIESVAPRLETYGGRLLAAGSGAVQLRTSDGKAMTVAAPAVIAPIVIGGPWRVAFESGRGAPPEIGLARLQSWPEHPDPGVKFFSGVATYRTGFSMPAAPAVGAVAFLDLGTVADLAEVRVNGALAGILWQPPFRADVTRLLRPGENVLEVRVANGWINRIIGDEGVPTDLKYQKPGTNKFTDGKLEQSPAWLYDRSRIAEKRRVSFTTWKHYTAGSPLVPAGLLGPVRLEWRSVIVP
jgi:hypothetical protein